MLLSLILLTETQFVVTNISLKQKSVFQQGSIFILLTSLLRGFTLLTY
jgi:hypothetical protein